MHKKQSTVMKCQKLQRKPKDEGQQQQSKKKKEKKNMCISVSVVGKGELILIAHAQWATAAPQ